MWKTSLKLELSTRFLFIYTVKESNEAGLLNLLLRYNS